MSKIKLVFSRSVMNDTALVNVANYTIIGPRGVPLTVTNITRRSSTTVDITVSDEFANGKIYTLSAVNLHDTNGNVIRIDRNAVKFTGANGISPKVSSAVAANEQVTITFNENMGYGAEEPTFYQIVGACTVTVISAAFAPGVTNQVILTTTEMRTGSLNFTVSVNALIEDAVGNPMDPSFLNAVFNGVGVAPQVSSASQPVGYKNKVTVVFNEAMGDIAGSLVAAGNYSVTGASSPAVSSVTYVNPTTVTLNLGSDMASGVHTVTAINVVDAAGNVIGASNHVDFTADTTNPYVSSMTFDNATHDKLFVNFDSVMSDVGLTDASHYSVAGPSGVIVSTITKMSSTQVRLNLSASITTDGNYVVTVIHVTDMLGNVIDAAHDEATAAVDVELPRVFSIGLYDTLHFYLIFDKAMKDNADLVASGNYEWSPHYTALTVSRISGTEIHLTPGVAIHDEPWIEIHAKNTTGGIKSLVEHTLDPAHDTAGFELDRVRPTVLSAAMVNTTHIDVTFDKTMNPTTAGDAAHYGVSGGGSPAVSSVTKQTDYVWRLNLGSAMTEGTITVDCKPAGASHITDNHGNLVDDAHDSAAFSYDVTGPHLNSVSIVDHGHLPSYTIIELVFSELLKNEAAITTVANYEITGPARGWPVFNPDSAAFGATHDKVRLTLDRELCNGESYAVLAIGLHDVYDNDLDVDHDTANFTDVNGAKPAMLDDGGDGSEITDVYTISVMFSEDIRTPGAAGNYSVRTFPGGSFLTIGATAQPANNVAQLQLMDAMTEGQDYLVTVDNSSVCDMAGNYVEPLMDQQIMGCPVF